MVLPLLAPAFSRELLLIGLAQGSEGDIGAYLTSRKFSLANYSFVYSFLIASLGIGSALGSALLSFTLHLTDRFDLFLWISAAATMLGALAFYLTGRTSTPDTQLDGVSR